MTKEEQSYSAVELEKYRSYLVVLAESSMDRRLREKLDAEDVVQQVMLRAHRSIDELRSTEPGAISAWLRQILTSELIDTSRRFRAARRDVRQEQRIARYVDSTAASLGEMLAAGHTSPSMGAMRNEEMLRLVGALATLPRETREVIRLKHLRGLTVAEVAEETGKTRASVAGLLSRGMAELRRLMKS